MDVSVSTAEDRNDLDFTNVLRDCLNCAVIVIDEHRKVAAINPRAEALFHLDARQALGKAMDSLPACVVKLINEALSAGKPVAGRQFSLAAGARGELTMRASVAPVGHREGMNSGVVVVLNDVSAAGKWENNMRRLDRLHSAGTLSASMAHEVKNAFVAVKTFVDLLLEQNKNTDLADIVRLEMGRIDTILGQMRNFSGPARPNFSEVRINFILDKSLTLIQHLLEDKQIKVSRSLAAGHDLLKGDPDQLEQAFINLLFNALDAMKQHGKLTVSTLILPPDAHVPGLAPARDCSTVQVTIRDNGAGIPPEHMDRLFEPFFTTKPEGTGLGLAITRRIIQEHHGVIKVHSELDKGTAFDLFLPTIGA